jgi:hypothetical protein
MATTLPIRKIYIDSRWCTPDSVSSSNFKVQVPRTMQMPDNTVFFVNDVCIPHTWTTIETGFNDKLYVLLLQTPAGVYSNHLLTLLAQNYTVPTFIQELQRAFATLPGDFSVTPDVNNGARIAVTDSSVKFKILTDDDVTTQRYWFEGRIDPNEINSANDNINNTVSSDTLIDISGYYSTGFMRLNWLNNIYITSPNLGSFDTIFAGRGDNNIIKKSSCNGQLWFYGY